MINPDLINFKQPNFLPEDIDKLVAFFSSLTEPTNSFWRANEEYNYGEKENLSMKFRFQVILRENNEKGIRRYDIFGSDGIPITNSDITVYPMLGSLIFNQNGRIHYIPNFHDEVIMETSTNSSLEEDFQELRQQHGYYSQLTFAVSEPIVDSENNRKYAVVRQIQGEKFLNIINDTRNSQRPLTLDEHIQITLELLAALKKIDFKKFPLKDFKWKDVLVEPHQPIKVDISYALPTKAKIKKQDREEQEAIFLKELGEFLYILWSDHGNLDSFNAADLKSFDYLPIEARKLISSSLENMLNGKATVASLEEATKAFKKVQAQTVITSEKIHNKNCYSYLRELLDNLPSFLLVQEEFAPLKKELEIIKNHLTYQNNHAYAKVYTQLIAFLDNNIEIIYKRLNKDIKYQKEKILDYQSLFHHHEYFNQSNKVSLDTLRQKKQELDNFIDIIYNNDSRLLEQTFEAIKHIPLNYRPSKSDKSIQHTIAKTIADQGPRINKDISSPADNEARLKRLTAVASRTFTPQYYTNIPSIRSYAYLRQQEHPVVTEIRIGTQAQRYEGKERVSPLFERWLKIQARKHCIDGEKKITHIYFNNLARDRGTFDFEGQREVALTKKLEDLESRHPNIAVITLPADKGLMDQKSHLKTKKEFTYDQVYSTFLNIAKREPEPGFKKEISDFYISEDIRELIFPPNDQKSSIEVEEEKLQKLLTKSFEAMGITPNMTLSQAERQAVWFHFIKFELTNYIIDNLKPVSINFSCKDAIDRGGVSSAYFNLLKSIESGHPLSREEFEQALHAASTSVKGRGMNHHLNVIWNVINAYVTTDYQTIKNNPELEWLIQWRDFNCPHSRVTKLLQQRIIEISADLIENKAKAQRDGHSKLIPKIDQALKIIDTIKYQSEKKVSGKRLLLEAASLTPTITMKPNSQNLVQYDKLADELRITRPKLQVIAGMMKSLIGVMLFIPSFIIEKTSSVIKVPIKVNELTKNWITKGFATAKAGYYADKRKTQVKTMKDQVSLATQLGMKEFDSKLRLINKENKEDNERESLADEYHRS
ncbi:hypothetical protein ACNVED_09440 [Legionella sp. D16C41]|uniref:hypothetical protein n=1 Tax=Legionella sp. D16C41 TaxID=3402688 RepID=UPI003AF93CC2